ncbi:uncharacterized protein N7503_000922 [Penicillium pulvis]|uniref:uncharacterized protein n=1 Tax=Penicillium pulvis TaxID=1562058 RepID=UPI002546FBA2|nr:uncharacterized protein N7503_000922 [Penicillium pulvis]KAJ5814172.1 hypothetical protein N7503_000922 [Penicillium pulvis]
MLKFFSSSSWLSVLLILCSCITSATIGYDGSLMNGLNILPAYNNYFNFDAALTGLSTATLYIGGFISGATWAHFTDYFGRKWAMFWAAMIAILATIVTTTAQNATMFIVGRVLAGYGVGASAVAAPTYLAETLPYKWRAWGLGLINDSYYIGGLVAAGVTYGTSSMGDTTWAWRIPSAIQAAFSVLCILILPFIPESLVGLYTWIATKMRESIVDAFEYEKNARNISFFAALKGASSRKRLLLASSTALFSIITGNMIASYYLGSFLTSAGIPNTNTQLQINIILNCFCLVCALVGTWFSDKIGRRESALISTILATICLFLVGVLSKFYGTTHDTSGIYGTIAMIFLFMGSYSFGWTPLLYLYPPEVLNYQIRATGMGLMNVVMNGAALLMLFALPFALQSIGWRTYMINAAWDVLIVVFIYFCWVETKGKTLEEVDFLFIGNRPISTSGLEKEATGDEEKDLEVEHFN